MNRSPPVTCRTLPRPIRSPSSPSTQEIREFLHNSPLGTPTPLSPSSCAEPTVSTPTTESGPPSPDIAPPVPLHNRTTICPQPEPQITEFLRHIRQGKRPANCRRPSTNPPSCSTSPTRASPPSPEHEPSSAAREYSANLNRMRAALDDSSSDEDQRPTHRPTPNRITAPPTCSPPTNTPTLAMDDPRSPETARDPPLDPDSSLDVNLPSTANQHLEEFQKHWTTIFSTNQPWPEFSFQCSLFAEAARTLATSLNNPPPRPPPTTTAAPHRPRGNRPTQSYNPAEAKPIQGLYRHSKKRAARKILASNSTTYTGIRDAAQHFLTEIFAQRHYDTEPLLTNLQQSVPAAEDDADHPVDEITAEEIRAKLRTAANTLPGPDRVEYTHLKRVDPQCTILSLIFNRCLREENVPQCWKDASTILIFKKDDPTDPSNFRPIALMSCVYKLLMGVLSKRLSTLSILEGILSNEQKSARPTEGCYEHTYLLKSVVRDAKVKKKSLYIAWLDIRNAFGSIPHEAIRTTLLHIGVANTLVSLISNAYSGATTTIRTSPEPTDPIPILSGVKQGRLLSAILFNLTIELILRAVKAKAPALPKNKALYHHDILLSCLAYADDLVLVARNRDALQTLLDSASSHASLLGLQFRPDKCATLGIINRKGEPTRLDPTPFTVQNHPVPTLAANESYRYLGFPIGLIHNIDDLIASYHNFNSTCVSWI